MKKNFKVGIVIFTLVFITIIFANYVANLLFSGKNSYETYEKLQETKKQLELNIDDIQQQNAKLQKDYFELKNLEPEE